MSLTTTGNSLVTRALRLLNVIAVNADPEPEDLANGFQTLQEMVDDWKTQRRTIWEVRANRHQLAVNTASYAIGAGGALNQERPLWIERFSIVPVRTVDLELPFRRALTLDEWQRIPIKSTKAPYPTDIYYDYAWNASGRGLVSVYPVPNTSTVDLILYTPQPLAEFATPTTVYTFPPGTTRALRYNLAVELAPDYPGSMTTEVQTTAARALANVKRATFRPKPAEFDSALVGRRGRYDPYSDSSR